MTKSSFNWHLLEWNFSQIIAYKCHNRTSQISSSAALIVDDINDNLPEIYFTSDEEPLPPIRILEETFATLFSLTDLYVEDVDLALHATYEVFLSQSTDALDTYANAFSIVPNNGYQRQSFAISVVDTKLIDYENPLWREFDVVVSWNSYSFESFTLQVFDLDTRNRNKLPRTSYHKKL